jgi:hypothetical protein
MKTTILRDGERYFGVDIEPDGSLIVYERANGRNESHARYPSGPAGAQALRQHITRTDSHPHVCTTADPEQRAERLARLAERLF